MVQLNKDQQLVREAVDTIRLPQERLARVWGVSFAAVHSWVTGARSPKPETMALMAKGLHEYADSAKEMAERLEARSRS